MSKNSGTNWIEERGEVEDAIRGEADYLKGVAKSLKVVGMDKLAQELHDTAVTLEYCAKRNGEITSLELNERLGDTRKAMGEVLATALHTATSK